jgi:hypothetical protein
MNTYEFTLRLNREVSKDEIEALYEAGCDDAGFETGPHGTLAQFDREARSLVEAILSAVRDVDKVGGLRAVGVACEDLVSLRDISERLGKSREAVRTWARGKRGPKGFPAAALITPGGEQLWDWVEVARWVNRRGDADIAVVPQVLVTADRVLAARDALRSEPDPTAREEFERLLEDA